MQFIERLNAIYYSIIFHLRQFEAFLILSTVGDVA